MAAGTCDRYPALASWRRRAQRRIAVCYPSILPFIFCGRCVWGSCVARRWTQRPCESIQSIRDDPTLGGKARRRGRRKPLQTIGIFFFNIVVCQRVCEEERTDTVSQVMCGHPMHTDCFVQYSSTVRRNQVAIEVPVVLGGGGSRIGFTPCVYRTLGHWKWASFPALSVVAQSTPLRTDFLQKCCT